MSISEQEVRSFQAHMGALTVALMELTKAIRDATEKLEAL